VSVFFGVVGVGDVAVGYVGCARCCLRCYAFGCVVDIFVVWLLCASVVGVVFGFVCVGIAVVVVVVNVAVICGLVVVTDGGVDTVVVALLLVFIVASVLLLCCWY